MTVTEPIMRHEFGAPWTVEDLFNVEDETHRYELFEGTLLVSPAPIVPHVHATDELGWLLRRAAPADLHVSTSGLGLYVSDKTYFVPDIIVVPRPAMKARRRGVTPSDARLVVEVLSPSNAGHDLMLKRHAYAAAGIPLYWIVDEDQRILTVLSLATDGGYYTESAVLRAGERFATDEPFPVAFDPAEIF
jgi:Uma2 family endonuclease